MTMMLWTCSQLCIISTFPVKWSRNFPCSSNLCCYYQVFFILSLATVFGSFSELFACSASNKDVGVCLHSYLERDFMSLESIVYSRSPAQNSRQVRNSYLCFRPGIYKRLQSQVGICQRTTVFSEYSWNIAVMLIFNLTIMSICPTHQRRNLLTILISVKRFGAKNKIVESISQLLHHTTTNVHLYLDLTRKKNWYSYDYYFVASRVKAGYHIIHRVGTLKSILIRAYINTMFLWNTLKCQYHFLTQPSKLHSL